MAGVVGRSTGDRPVSGTVVVELWPPCAGSGRSSGIGGGVEVRVIRRLVGVDLGIASAHTVRVLAEGGREVCRRRCEPTVDSLARVEAAALAGTPAGTVLEVVMEPTGPAWLPVAVFFMFPAGVCAHDGVKFVQRNCG